MFTTIVIDGMAVVHMVKSGSVSTFGQLVTKLYQTVAVPLSDNGYNRVGMVFDNTKIGP